MTTTIGLITTGQCEHLALASSLARVFADADVEFTTLFGGPADSITSGYVSYPAPPSPVASVAERLAARMAAQLESRRGPGFVFAIDDLELDNVETPGNVAGVVRDAVVRALGSTPTHAEQARYRERCSFHLLCPMVEAYFYGEPAALTRAGAHAPALVVQTEHLEAFLAGDMAYLVPPDEPGHAWRSPGRAKHPKRYLRFLAMPDRYQEAKGGRDALATLDWRQVFDRQPPGLGFALALFEDLADAIGVPCPFRGEARSETARRVDGVLCNL